MVCILTYNVTGVMVTKYASAAQRSTLDVTRTLFVWVFFLLIGQESFLIGEFLGFVCLVMGTLTYNEIIEIPLKPFMENTKRALAIKEKERIKRSKESVDNF